MFKIKNIHAREILDSRGFPTVETEVEVSKNQGEEIFCGRAAVPSGASTGEAEALELRDNDAKRFLGKGVLKAISNVNVQLRTALIGREFKDLKSLDHFLIEMDGTPTKSKLGANAILSVSMAFIRAMANANSRPLFKEVAEAYGSKGTVLPVPMMNILNGGKHADNGLAIQEFMIVPLGFSSFKEALRAGVEVFHRLKKILHTRGLSTAVGDEGGFAPYFEGEKPHEQALTAIMQAIQDTGYKPGKDIFIALDPAASEFSEKSNISALPGESFIYYQFEGKKLNSKEMIHCYLDWMNRFPIISIEDGLSEHDWKGWAEFTDQASGRCQLVGDDLFVTNPAFLKKGIESRVANSILIKVNQIGTVSEALEAMKIASTANYSTVVSHRSGETEDAFIADLVVGTDSGQIKTGSASRSDRLAKYNQLLRIEEMLGSSAYFAGRDAFRNVKF